MDKKKVKIAIDKMYHIGLNADVMLEAISLTYPHKFRVFAKRFLKIEEQDG
jgi:hypothetical protein